MATTLYQQPNSDNLFFVYANNPIYYTAISDEALTHSDFYYRVDLYRNQAGGTSADLVNSSKIYPDIREGALTYNPINLLKSELTEYFYPDEFGFHYPDNIVNYRVDVTEYYDGITHEEINEVAVAYGIQNTELVLGGIYKIQSKPHLSSYDFTNFNNRYLGTSLPATLTIGLEFIVTEESGLEPLDWGSTERGYVRLIKLEEVTTTVPGAIPVSYDKNICINGTEQMTPDSLKLDGTEPLDYVLNSNTKQMFTRQNFVNKVNMNERATLRCIEGKMLYNSTTYNSSLDNVIIEVIHPDGSGNRYKFRYDNGQKTWSTNTERYSTDNTKLQDLTGMLVDIPVGPYNIYHSNTVGIGYNQTHSKTAGGDWITDEIVNVDSTTMLSEGDVYSVESYGNKSKKYYYEVTCDNQYQPYQLAWENELGGYDYFSFKMVSKSSEASEKQQYEIKKDRFGSNVQHAGYTTYYGRNPLSKGNQIFDVKSNEVIELNTNWLSNSELEFLRDLFKSKNVYLLDETIISKYNNKGGGNPEALGRWYPVIIDGDTIEFKTNVKGLKQLNLSVIKNTTKQ